MQSGNYLASFFRTYEGQVQPEFPTGNGAIDLLIRYVGQLFGLELKSFANFDYMIRVITGFFID